MARALRGSGRIDPRTQERIVAAAQELGYRPNSAAQSVASGRFGCVTLLLGTVTGHSHLPEHLLSGIHDALWEVGMQLKFARLPDSALTNRARLPAVLTEWSCDGLLVDYTHDIPPAMVETIETGGLSAVWINTPRTTDCVRPDDEAMGRMATEHLLALGHGRLGQRPDRRGGLQCADGIGAVLHRAWPAGSGGSLGSRVRRDRRACARPPRNLRSGAGRRRRTAGGCRPADHRHVHRKRRHAAVDR